MFSKSLQRSQPLKEQAYQSLREMILSRELTSGQRLVEAQLARDLQVSRTSIQEALVMNDSDRLHMATFSTTNVAQLYECRMALEQVSVNAACYNATAAQLRKLQRLVEQSEKLVDIKNSQMLNFQLLELDYQFHHLIAEMSGNFWLQAMLDKFLAK